MQEWIRRFLEKVDAIKRSKPTYRQPGDGSDGTCDCIGLIIGSVRRLGLKWPGIHGSNYSARCETVGLARITSLSQLELGDYVYKAYEPGEGKYKLPDRYKKGGAYYNGDLKDYYHVGVVTSLNPVIITHMTSPTVKTLTVQTLKDLGKWGFHGKVKPIVVAAGGITPAPAPIPIPIPVPVPQSGSYAIVAAASGRYVKMRQQPSTKCGLYEEVPVGATVTLEQPGEVWAKVSYGRRKGWYMMAQFLDVVEKAA